MSTDGTRILTTGGDQTARLWDARDGALLWTYVGVRWSASLDRSGRRVIAALTDGTARVSDAQMTAHDRVLRGHREDVTSARFSPDGTRILTASSDRAIKLWETATGRELASTPPEPSTQGFVAWSPDGARFLTIDGTARLWDSRDGRLLGTIASQSWIREATFSPDGKRVLTASSDGTARTWEVPAMPWTEGELERFLRCRVPFRFEKRGLSPARTDPALCQRPRVPRHEWWTIRGR